MSDKVLYFYLIGVIATFVFALVSIRQRGYKITLSLVLLSVFTATLSWAGLCVIYNTFYNRD